MELLPLHFNERETFMVHANAVLTPRGRLLLARLIVDEGWPVVRAAEHFHVFAVAAAEFVTHAITAACRSALLSNTFRFATQTSSWARSLKFIHMLSPLLLNALLMALFFASLSMTMSSAPTAQHA